MHNTPNLGLREIFVPAVFYPFIFLLLAAIVTRFSAINAMDEQEQTYRQLLAMLHHQLLHPSSVIAAIADVLEHGERYNNWTMQEKEYLRQLKRENLRLNTMITNVLESARDPKREQLIKTKPVNLLQLLNDSAVSCAVATKRIKDLDTHLPNQKVELHAQPEQIRTAFDNVIENAFRYSEEGTPVKVSLSHNADKGSVTIKVEDKGKGMSASDQKRLFHLFTQLQERSGRQSDGGEELYSLGLGLYVSKVIVERHNGTLDIKSKEGVGTTVTIKIQEELWRRAESYI
jgi:signal transduction histidine kinase